MAALPGPPGNRPQSTAAATRPACATCANRKKRCTWISDDPAHPCDRCARLGASCERQDFFVRRMKKSPQLPQQVPREALLDLAQPEGRSRQPSAAGGQAFRIVSLVPADAFDGRVESPVSRTLTPTLGKIDSPRAVSFPVSTRLPISGGRTPPTNLDRTTGDSNLVYACISAFWNSVHPVMDFLHRDSVERAFLDGRSPLYGPQKPIALLCAMAANGSPFLDAPHLSPKDRAGIAASYAAQAEDLLASHLRDPLRDPMTDIEAAQVLLLLQRFHLTSGSSHDALRGRSMLAEVVSRLLPPERELFGIDLVPADPAAWVRSECLVRLAIQCSSSCSDARGTQEGALFDYCTRAVVLPCHDIYFNLRAEHAYALLFVAQPAQGRMVVDASPLLAGNCDPEAAISAVQAIFSGIFSLRCSRLASLYVADMITRLHGNILDRASDSGIDTVRLATQDRNRDSPHERRIREANALLSRLGRDIYVALPPDIGPALASGDSEPLFARATELLCDDRHALALCSVLVKVHSLIISAWMQGGTAPTSASFYASEPMGAILESGIVGARLLEAMLERDQDVTHCHLVTFPAALIIGALAASIAAASGEGQQTIPSAVHDAKVAEDFMRAFGRRFPIAGAKLVPGMLQILSHDGGEATPAARSRAASGGSEAFVARIQSADIMASNILGLRGSEQPADDWDSGSGTV